MDTYYIYILASRHHSYISIDVTAELLGAVKNHRQRINRKLERKRVFQKLVYVEAIRGVHSAVSRERQLKKFNRAKLEQLIESVNPCWDAISLTALSKSGYSHINQLL